MGQVHARAFSRLRQHYVDLPVAPVLVAVADNAADDRLAAAVSAYGFTDVHADWPDLVARPDLDVICVTGPNFIHRDVGVAVARAGKHLWIEKPAGRSAAETLEIRDAVREAGVAVGGRLQLPQRARGRAGPAADRRRVGWAPSSTCRYGCWPTTLRTPRAL